MTRGYLVTTHYHNGGFLRRYIVVANTDADAVNTIAQQNLGDHAPTVEAELNPSASEQWQRLLKEQGFDWKPGAFKDITSLPFAG